MLHGTASEMLHEQVAEMQAVATQQRCSVPASLQDHFNHLLQVMLEIFAAPDHLSNRV